MKAVLPEPCLTFDLGAGPKGGPNNKLVPLDAALAQELGEAFAAMSPWRDYPLPASALARYLSQDEPGAPRFCIIARGEVAGATGLRRNWLRGPYLQFLGVLPAYQGRGLGAAVLDWMEQDARAAGEGNLWVAASDFNAGAIRFYERGGFHATARLDGLVRDGKTEVLMRKRLS